MCGNFFGGSMPDMSAFRRKPPVAMKAPRRRDDRPRLVASDTADKLRYSVPWQRAAVVLAPAAIVAPPWPTPARLDVIHAPERALELV